MKKEIAKLNELFPNIKAVSTLEWDGDDSGIWFRQEGNCHTDGKPYFNYHNVDTPVHPEVAKVLKDLGLYAEPYDAGTWMAYKE
jgi:hypothetical protein